MEKSYLLGFAAQQLLISLEMPGSSVNNGIKYSFGLWKKDIAVIDRSM